MSIKTPLAIITRSIRLETSTVCQLKCPTCPTALGTVGDGIGRGFLKFTDFKSLIDKNPQLSRIELSNWGEMFLNKELPAMLEYAYRQNVALYAYNGVNLNTASPEALEAIVKYKLRGMTCSIDGASQETYVQYRVKGNFDDVIENIKTINRFKRLYRSRFPLLRWQFVAFGHNEHEIAAAHAMAKSLNMEFFAKLSWDDLYTTAFSPVRDREYIKAMTGLDAADREEYLQKYGKEYAGHICAQLWKNPQINYDGRVLGCCINHWGDYGNVFQDGLAKTVNNEKMGRARYLMAGGPAAPNEDIPCLSCKVYHSKQKNKAWLSEAETRPSPAKSRLVIMLENKTFYYFLSDFFDQLLQFFTSKEFLPDRFSITLRKQ